MVRYAWNKTDTQERCRLGIRDVRYTGRIECGTLTAGREIHREVWYAHCRLE